MDRRIIHSLSILFLLFSLTSLFNDFVAAESTNGEQRISANQMEKTRLLKYWSKKVSPGLPKSSFLLSKASPLNDSQSAYLTKLASEKQIPSHLSIFCTWARLFCLPSLETRTARTSPQGLPPGDQGSGQANNSNGMQFANYNTDFSAYEINKNNTGSSFTNYSDETNFGLALFKDYSKEGGAGAVAFANYSQNSDFGTYESTQPPPEPESLSRDKTSATKSSSLGPDSTMTKKISMVEAGKFFRESQLSKGNIIPMPDIRDKMPRRSFLPRSIWSELPFSSSDIKELKAIFHAADNSTMEWVILNALIECERNPSPGETKKCVGSIEDMIDFATLVLGHNVVVRTTKNVHGSSQNVMIGSLKAINAGKVTKAVSCHQSLYPSLMYYCHSVPKVRVYEAEIVDVNSKKKINHGVAICHLDTSTWSPLHAAFLLLGNGPGKIEVCHWIFQNDMTWTLAH